MARRLVNATIKPARKAELASRLADGTLARGSAGAEALLGALRAGYARGDEVVFLVEEEVVPLAREALDRYLRVDRVRDAQEVAEADLARIERDFRALPEWAGVDPA